MKAEAPLAHTVDSLSKSAKVGRTNIFEAIRVGELKTISPVINGKKIKRRLITPGEAERWLSTFPDTDTA